jgi:hypothetical protein
MNKYIIFFCLFALVLSQTEDCIKNCMDEWMECLDEWQNTVCYCMESAITCEIKGNCYTDEQKKLINADCINYDCPFCSKLYKK